MRIRIHHSTIYEYSQPVQLHRHRLVLRPREGHDQRLESMQLRIEPAHALTWARDVFGNSIAWVDFDQPAAVLRIENELIVDRTAPFPERVLHRPFAVAHPVVYDPMEQAVVSAYLATSYPDDAQVLSTWIGSRLQVDAADAEGTVLSLAKVIHQDIQYRRREEKGVQTPAQTLQLRGGSCRDMATLMMEGARGIGIAARFASGYLHGTASLAGHASTHAWVEVYLPGLGWRGFDPTLAQPSDHRHIVTGVSNHPRGVMPVSGTYTRGDAEFRGMSASVRTELLAERPA
jgi:transglutaminase-like putative cysteine protease